MSTVTGLTAERMLEIEAASVVDGEVIVNDLVLTKHDGSTIAAGNVRGPIGPQGDPGVDGADGADGTDFLGSAAGGELAGTYPNPTLSGTLASGRVFTWGVDTNLYRSAANALKTDDQFIATLGVDVPAGAGYTAAQIAAAVVLGNKLLAADANRSFDILGDGKHEWGAGGATAVDTNLYRSAADTLKTDDHLMVVREVYSRQGNGAQVLIGAAGPGGIAGVAFGSSQDTNIYRSAADILKTDDALVVALGVSVSAGAGYTAAQIAAAVVMGNKLLAADANYAHRILGDGKTEWGAGGATALDTNLYRFVAGHLRTDGQFTQKRTGGAIATYGIVQGANGFYSYQINSDGKMEWGPGATDVDTNLYRASADQLKTDDSFQSVGIVQGGNLKTLGEVFFGSLGDTSLFRQAADQLRTNDEFQSLVDIYARVGAAQTGIGNLGPASQPGIRFTDATTIIYRAGASQINITGEVVFNSSTVYFGSAADTNLYRSAADTLKTDDSFYSTQTIYAKQGAAAQVGLGALGPASEAGIAFGSASDVKLYRYSATILHTDSSFDAKNYRAVFGSGNAFTSINTSGQVQFTMTWNGIMTWGLNDSADTNLYRDAADVLATDDSLKFKNTASRLIFGHAGQEQITVGAAGGASALPATPTKFIKIKDSAGVELVIPAYAAV